MIQNANYKKIPRFESYIFPFFPIRRKSKILLFPIRRKNQKKTNPLTGSKKIEDIFWLDYFWQIFRKDKKNRDYKIECLRLENFCCPIILVQKLKTFFCSPIFRKILVSYPLFPENIFFSFLLGYFWSLFPIRRNLPWIWVKLHQIINGFFLINERFYRRRIPLS